jgi:hypothetical protein
MRARMTRDSVLSRERVFQTLLSAACISPNTHQAGGDQHGYAADSRDDARRFGGGAGSSETTILRCVVENAVAQPDPAFGAVGSAGGLQQ